MDSTLRPAPTPDRRVQPSALIAVVARFAPILGLVASTSAHADPVRLDLRIVAQSGTPGVLCVYNDPPNPFGSADPPIVAWCSPNIARRFEVQYRLADTDAGDGLVPAGLRTVRLNIRAATSTAGLWGRAVLSLREGDPAPADLDEPPPRIDCAGLPVQPTLRKRGLHTPFRSLLTGADPSEDADNGAFQASGLFTIRALAAGPIGQADGWFGLYSFEFTPSATLSGSVSITAEAVPDSPPPAGSGVVFEFFDQSGVARPVSTPAAATITVRVPAAPVACCRPSICYIALTPSACFASAGFIATGNICGPTAFTNCCFADFNRDGHIGVQDLFDFLVAYQSNSPLADFNGDGTLSIQDVFDFLTAYFTGCG